MSKTPVPLTTNQLLANVFMFLERVDGENEPKSLHAATVLIAGAPDRDDTLFITTTGEIYLHGVGGYASITGRFGGFNREACTVVRMLQHAGYLTDAEAVAFEDWFDAEVAKFERERAMSQLYSEATRYGFKLVKVK